MRRLWPTLVLAFLLTFASTLAPLLSAVADEGGPPPETVEIDQPDQQAEALIDDAPALEGTLPLSLGDAVAMGIENNLNIQIERFAPVIAEENAAIAWSAYDPMGTGSASYFSSYEPPVSALSGNVSRDVTRQGAGELGLQGLVPYLGASIGLVFNMDESRTNNVFASYSPTYNSSLGVTASVPLLKNLIWNEPWTVVKTAAIAQDASIEVFRTGLMDVVQGIETSYWNLVATKEQERVARKSLETAESLLNQVETQYEVGVVSRVQVVEAEAGVAAREVDVIRQENFYRSAQDQLIDAVLGTHLTAGSRLEIEPLDNPADYVAYEVDVETVTANAFRQRPELQAMLKDIERLQVQLKFAKNQWLPEFNIEGGYSVSGLRGKGKPTPNFNPPPDSFDNPDTGDGIGDTFADWGTDHGGKEFSVRGVVRVPLGNIRGRHTLSKSRLELRRAETQEQQLRQRIILEVRNGARNLKSAQKGIVAAERRRLAAEEQLRAERIRLEYGESTPFDVLQRESDLVDAESQKIGALQLYRTSQVDLQRAQGTILQGHNIIIESASGLR